MLNIKKEEAVVIGDQVFTDILGANRSGLASILVRFIRQDDEKWIGKRRYVEYAILECWKRDKSCYRRIGDIYTEGTDFLHYNESRHRVDKFYFSEFARRTNDKSNN